VPMRVAGAAIESAYKIIDALEFYEGVWKRERIAVSNNEVDYAIARWVKSKLRLAALLEEEGKRSGAGKHRVEAENVCGSRLGINKDNIPEEPEFDVSEARVATVISKARASAVSHEIRQAILDLHKIGRTPHDLAKIFSLELELIESIIQRNG
jgi:hypothetical protein